MSEIGRFGIPRLPQFTDFDTDIACLIVKARKVVLFIYVMVLDIAC